MTAAGLANAGAPGLTDEDVALALELIALDTVTPMESGRAPEIRAAQERYAAHAAALGFEVVLHAPPPPSILEGALIPARVREASARMGEAFLTSQPNLVLRLGPAREPERTIVLNAHIDTVGGDAPSPALEEGVLHGRGAVDMKGPAVALLAAVRRALALRPDLPERTTVLVHLVAGEEGGAMGVHGTRAVLDAGHDGALIVIAEPTGGRFFDCATATMTAEVAVEGEGSTDDAPELGHNATVLLGHLAAELAERLDGPVTARGGRLCVAGAHTGDTHDRVFGSGRLLLNLAYPDAEAGDALREEVEAAHAAAVESFERRFAGVGLAARTARDARRIAHLRWLKRGLPALRNRDPEWERVLAALGVPRGEPADAFTCDAIWGARASGHTIVFGPGDLAEGGAHTDREHVRVDDLARYAETLAGLLLAFDERSGTDR